MLRFRNFFYDANLQTLGFNKGKRDAKGRYNYISDTGVLCITRPINGELVSRENGSTIDVLEQSESMVEQ